LSKEGRGTNVEERTDILPFLPPRGSPIDSDRYEEDVQEGRRRVTRLDLQGIEKMAERPPRFFFSWPPVLGRKRFHVETCEKSSKSEGVRNIRGGRSFSRKNRRRRGGTPTNPPCEFGEMDITSAFQAEFVGSSPIIRTKPNRTFSEEY
jgi:hypothetical protein